MVLRASDGPRFTLEGCGGFWVVVGGWVGFGAGVGVVGGVGFRWLVVLVVTMGLSLVPEHPLVIGAAGVLPFEGQ
ncbi:hypothetical protein, partial [Pseudomonas aeruginosa]|uniref:hypothetical protein n=1 Tax=Pseudomonas aeruginosa TaxID=287 RepID=UPI003F818660